MASYANQQPCDIATHQGDICEIIFHEESWRALDIAVAQFEQLFADHQPGKPIRLILNVSALGTHRMAYANSWAEKLCRKHGRGTFRDLRVAFVYYPTSPISAWLAAFGALHSGMTLSIFTESEQDLALEWLSAFH